MTLTVDTLDLELRDLTEAYPERNDPSISGGAQERARARAQLKELVLALREIDVAAQNAASRLPVRPSTATERC